MLYFWPLYVYSEVNLTGMFFVSPADRPLIVQFAAKDAQTLVDAACVVAPFSDGVDLNCGCPQRYRVFMISKFWKKCTWCLCTVEDCDNVSDAYSLVPHFCPWWCCRWAMSEGYGACLINKPDLVKDMVRQVRNQIEDPSYAVSIKIRWGIAGLTCIVVEELKSSHRALHFVVVRNSRLISVWYDHILVYGYVMIIPYPHF